jgi:hypothetical protein
MMAPRMAVLSESIRGYITSMTMVVLQRPDAVMNVGFAPAVIAFVKTAAAALACSDRSSNGQRDDRCKTDCCKPLHLCPPYIVPQLNSR